MIHPFDNQFTTSQLQSGAKEPESRQVLQLIAATELDEASRQSIKSHASSLIAKLRSSGNTILVEQFLALYPLHTPEGVALMRLAEAFTRIPDRATKDALIADKLANGNWRQYRGKSASTIVNLGTFGLQIAASLLKCGQHPSRAVRALSSISTLAIRLGTHAAMRFLGNHYVYAQSIEAAEKKSRRSTKMFSFDMLGEAAVCKADAERYFEAYRHAILVLAKQCGDDFRSNPGISVKLSALDPRYETAKASTLDQTLLPQVKALAMAAKAANMGFNIDAEEGERLELSRSIFACLVADPDLAGWQGLGMVVQAYNTRAVDLIDWLHGEAIKHQRQITVRLVKGAYWDVEIKRAQVLGLDDFPVFTHKSFTDVSYLACTRKLLECASTIYPQFATHNAHTLAALHQMAKQQGLNSDAFEIQRLYGMGAEVHHHFHRTENTLSRIYAPVGNHRDLLPYLVRRLLENGANSSFVSQIANSEINPELVASDPIAEAIGLIENPPSTIIAQPSDIFAPERTNSEGWDLDDPTMLDNLLAARDEFKACRWQASPLVAGRFADGKRLPVINPADPDDQVGTVVEANSKDVYVALEAAQNSQSKWGETAVKDRAAMLDRTADLYEENAPELMAIAAREAGKSLADAVSEIREAVDFLRYYAAQIRQQNSNFKSHGIFVCISPWNFPLAIFTGQIAAALAAGNCVIAKPAPQTPLMAHRAISLMHQAGIPMGAVQLLPGDGPQVGGKLVSDPRISGVCFTGSTTTAHIINKSIAQNLTPFAPFIAETGGLNAMIVDSSALLEQVVKDVIASSFQSAGQRCSALRMIYVQEDIFNEFSKLLQGAMATLQCGNPWQIETDVGPVIDEVARTKINTYVESCNKRGHVLASIEVPRHGHFVSPTLIEVSGIEELQEEIFGPVLHLAVFRSGERGRVVEAINAKGYGLTFGMHSRIDNAVAEVSDAIDVGNIYINRNQIGAVVGSQPFGGHGLSGTGPKAGGPNYLSRFQHGTPGDELSEFTS